MFWLAFFAFAVAFGPCCASHANVSLVVASMLMLTVLTVLRVRRFAAQPGYTA